MRTEIPQIIHQTWKDRNIPPSYASYQQSWLTHHHEWEYRLWTDDDNRALIEEHYAWFLPIYDNYPQPIMRVDAVRYFILHYHGGLYVDLDFESLQPLDHLFHNQELVIGIEPPEHALGSKQIGEKPLVQVLSNAFMASVPRHPFWEHLFKVLIGTHLEPFPLKATGPYMLSKAHECFDNPDCISLVSDKLLFPIAYGETWSPNDSSGSVTLAPSMDVETVQPIAVHHWNSTWKHKNVGPTHPIKQKLKGFLRSGVSNLLNPLGYHISFKDATNEEPLFAREIKERQLNATIRQELPIPGASIESNQFGFALLRSGQPILRGYLDEIQCRQYIKETVDVPLLSAIFESDSCLDSAKRAVATFQAQLYPNKELVVVENFSADCLKDTDRSISAVQLWLESIENLQLVYVPFCPQAVSPESSPNGDVDSMVPDVELAIQHASGSYVTCWSDYAFSHPERLILQVALLNHLNGDACSLQRVQVWSPQEEKLVVSGRDIWAKTGVYLKSRLSSPKATQRDCSFWAQELSAAECLLVVDCPKLYTAVDDSSCATEEPRFDNLSETSTACYEGLAYEAIIQNWRSTSNSALSHWLGRAKGDAKSDVQRNVTVSRPQKRPRHAMQAEATAPDTGCILSNPPPKILLAMVLGDDTSLLSDAVALLQKLSYPREQLTLAILDGGSSDGASGRLQSLCAEWRSEFGDVKLIEHSAKDEKSMCGLYAHQREERVALAQTQNNLLARTLTDEAWVLWLDIRCIEYPRNLIEQLLHTKQKIVVPHLVQPNGASVDKDSYQLVPGAEAWDWSPYILDGILQPPKGHGRTYMKDLREHQQVELTSVGHLVLLVEADLYRKGLVFPPVPYKYHIGAEGLAYMARDMGYRCWGLPQLEVVIDLE